MSSQTQLASADGLSSSQTGVTQDSQPRGRVQGQISQASVTKNQGGSRQQPMAVFLAEFHPEKAGPFLSG